MKKIFDNPYLDHAIKIMITLATGSILYLMIDIRDFVKYRQPIRDDRQDLKLENVQNSLLHRIEFMDSIYSLKYRNINIRIDNLRDVIYGIDRKIDILIGYNKANKINKINPPNHSETANK